MEVKTALNNLNKLIKIKGIRGTTKVKDKI